MFLAHFLLQPAWRRAKFQAPHLHLSDATDFSSELADIAKELDALEATKPGSLSDVVGAAKELEAVVRQSSRGGMEAFGLSSGEVALGMRHDVDVACDQLGARDWLKMNTLSQQIEFVEEALKSSTSPAEIASCLAFLIKRAFLLMRTAKSPDIVVAQHEFLSAQLGPCWDAFQTVFVVLETFRIEDLNTIPKYLSRFIHFWRSYADSTELTENNMRHAEQIAPHIHRCMLKQSLSVPPHSIGRNYSSQKMAREILCALSMRYPSSSLLEALMFHSLDAAREYYGSISKNPRKLGLANSLAAPRQLILDELLETLGPGSNAKTLDGASHPTDMMQGELLTDLTQFSAVNRFGSVESLPSFREPGILHLHYVVHNEATLGLRLHLSYEGRFLSIMIRENHHGVLGLVTLALQESIDGKRRAMRRWDQLAKQLDLPSLPDHLDKLKVPLGDVRRICVYADGQLANAPWRHLLATFALSGPRAALPIVVRVGSMPASSAFEADGALVLGAWRYNANPSLSARRRGDYREGEFGNLPGVESEVGQVEALLAGAGVMVERHNNLSASESLERVNSLTLRSIMHLGCHGVAATGGRPVIWLPAIGAEKKRRYSALHAERVFRTNWEKCEFVFINACFGGSSAPFVGGPPLGFTEPFAASGVKAMLAPLWPVGDQTAAAFASEFYSNLIATRDYCVAYNRACATMTADTSADHLTMAAYTFVLF